MSETVNGPRLVGTEILVPQAAAKSGVDWDQIAVEYRAGVLSIRQIARNHDISDAAIRKRAKEDGWERDLTQQVQESIRAKLARSLCAQPDPATDRQTVEAAAARSVEVVRQHRVGIGRGREITQRLLDELDATTSHLGEMEAEINSEEVPQRRAAMMKAVSLPGRAGAMRDLASAARNWIVLERIAFGLGDDSSEVVPITVQIRRFSED